MARDAEAIEREIEEARDALAATLDELGSRPQRAMEAGKEQVQATLGDPRVKYSLIAAAVLVLLLVLRKLLR